jgi:hypothetical protein
MEVEKEKKRPGRKKKSQIQDPIIIDTPPVNEVIHKKRGRKPKGGKIIITTELKPFVNEAKQNIILHIKCCLSDIKDVYDVNFIQSNNTIIPFNKDNMMNEYNVSKTTSTNVEFINDKELWDKIKSLASSLHSNIPPNKVSDCFWCTCSFDGPPVFIPKNIQNHKFNVYGNFCSPECGCAFLFNQSIDSAQKFERYHLLNHLYSDIYKYKQCINPAPSPYYILSKYLGNLSINEYRKLNNHNQLISIIDKPMIRNFPELFEDIEEHNIKSVHTNNTNNNEISTNYKLFKKSSVNKKKSLSEHFGLINT